MTTITRERLLKIQQWRETYGPGSNVVLPVEEAEELARIALSSLETEQRRNPVLAYADSYRDMAKQGVESIPVWSVITDLERNIAPLFTAPPAPTVTFYRDGIEAAATWVDQQRESYDSEHGCHDPDTGFFEFGNDAQRDYSATLEEIAEGIRALHPNAAPPEPVFPETLPCAVELKPGLIIGKGCKTETLLTALQRRADYYAEIDAMTPEERAEHEANIEAFKAMLPQPAPVVPDDLAKAFISAIEKEQDRLFGEDYLMDSKDCIDVIREEALRLNACRAAMLQGSQPVSNRDELPPDEIECDICGHVSTDPEGRHYCCEDNSND